MLCASKNNTTQVVGLLDNSTILPINVTDINGDISSSSFIRAIYYAVDSGAKIINMSFCGSEFNEAEDLFFSVLADFTRAFLNEEWITTHSNGADKTKNYQNW